MNNYIFTHSEEEKRSRCDNYGESGKVRREIAFILVVGIGVVIILATRRLDASGDRGTADSITSIVCQLYHPCNSTDVLRSKRVQFVPWNSV